MKTEGWHPNMDNDNHKMTEAEYYRRAHWDMTQEAARLRAEVERLRSEKGNAVYWCGINERRAEDAEAKLRAVEALADEWETLWRRNDPQDGPAMLAALFAARSLRAVLDSHPTGTPEAGE